MAAGGKAVNLLETPEAFDALPKDQLSVLYFTAAWCGPCRLAGPYYEKLASASSDPNVKFYKIDVEEYPDLAQKLGVASMPTFQWYKDGKKEAQVLGFRKDQIEEKHSLLTAAPPAHSSASAPAPPPATEPPVSTEAAAKQAEGAPGPQVPEGLADATSGRL